jgi:hypothetical protein
MEDAQTGGTKPVPPRRPRSRVVRTRERTLLLLVQALVGMRLQVTAPPMSENDAH